MIVVAGVSVVLLLLPRVPALLKACGLALLLSLALQQSAVPRCERSSTRAACEHFRAGKPCGELAQTFAADPEWAEYRFAVKYGLPASPARLQNAYSAEKYFSRCPEEAAEIRAAIEAFDGQEAPEKQSHFQVRRLLFVGAVGIVLNGFFLVFKK